MTKITLPPDECAITTQDHMTKLELLVPELADGTPLPPLMRYLMACCLRAYDDPAFVAKQIKWFDDRLNGEKHHE